MCKSHTFLPECGAFTGYFAPTLIPLSRGFFWRVNNPLQRIYSTDKTLAVFLCLITKLVKIIKIGEAPCGLGDVIPRTRPFRGLIKTSSINWSIGNKKPAEAGFLFRCLNKQIITSYRPCHPYRRPCQALLVHLLLVVQQSYSLL